MCTDDTYLSQARLTGAVAVGVEAMLEYKLVWEPSVLCLVKVTNSSEQIG
jgi:hypothetical protein